MTTVWSSAYVAMVITATAAVDAQSPPNTADRTGRRFLAIGCVSRQQQAGAGPGARRPGYILTDARGEPPLRYRLDGDPEMLSFHAGHSVEISGSVAASPSSTTPPVLKIETLTYLAKNCSTNAP